jgi:hypothetical protein
MRILLVMAGNFDGINGMDGMDGITQIRERVIFRQD